VGTPKLQMSTCRFCAAPFIPRDGGIPQVFCSSRCKQDFHNVRSGAASVGYVEIRRKYANTQQKCLRCGKEFWVGPRPKKEGLFCSKNCSRVHQRTALKSLYGITVDDYDHMFALQGGVCAICKDVCGTGRRLCVDHDHNTGRVRGLLCMSCNQKLGWFEKHKDSALQYLYGKGAG
jgi:endogenous inhibitor of DNA gyrase (YacG/DUF329 family)